jgi:hypothetical protein
MIIERDSDIAVKSLVRDFKGKFLFVGNYHMHPWYSFVIIGAMIGMFLGIVYVANRGLYLTSSQAAANLGYEDPGDYYWDDDYEPSYFEDVVLTSRQPLPAQTIITIVWASKSRPKKIWMDESAYEARTIKSSETESLIRPIQYGPFADGRYDTDEVPSENAIRNMLGESAELRAIVQYSLNLGGQVFMSTPIQNGHAVVDTSGLPIADPVRQQSNYEIKLTFENEVGVRLPMDPSLIECFYELVEVPANYLDSYGCFKTSPNGKGLTSPGPTPIVTALAPFASSESLVAPDGTELFPEETITPAENGGTFEYVLYDSLLKFDNAHENDSDEEYFAAAGLFDFNDLKEIIYTPVGGQAISTKPGSSVTTGQINPDDLGLHIRLSGGASSIKTKYGTRIANLTIGNVSANLTRLTTKKPGKIIIPYVTVTLKTANGSAIPSGLNVRTAVREKNKDVFSKPIICVIDSLDSSQCKVKIKKILQIAPGKSKIFGLVLDVSKFIPGTLINLSIARAEDIPYTYVESIKKNKKVKTKYMLNPKQVPFKLPSFTVPK